MNQTLDVRHAQPDRGFGEHVERVRLLLTAHVQWRLGQLGHGLDTLWDSEDGRFLER